jgi:hypothetical protein
LMALQPPPPTPTTLMRANDSACACVLFSIFSSFLLLH